MLANSSLLKVVLLGDSGVGKTALMKMYCDKKFDKSYQATIGADFLQKDMMVNDKAITMQIWDTAGQERFKSLVCRFYRGADACILVYDVTNAQSFERIEFWMREFVEHADIKDPKRFPFLIVGNKNDLHDQRKVSESKAKAWCKNNGDLQFVDTSAKVNHNVELAFTKVVQLALEIQSDFEDIYNTDIADVMLSNDDLPTQQSGSASGSGMISSISEMFASSGSGDPVARETSGRRASTRSETPQREESKGIVQIAQDTGEGAMSFLEQYDCC